MSSQKEPVSRVPPSQKAMLNLQQARKGGFKLNTRKGRLLAACP
jgi:hypothetical protein